MDTNKVWSLITVALRHCNRILVWGLPGTGKSFLAQREALGFSGCFQHNFDGGHVFRRTTWALHPTWE
jgi:SpoVK/Ycf46/Vps4 family AAA+-type ATPase